MKKIILTSTILLMSASFVFAQNTSIPVFSSSIPTGNAELRPLSSSTEKAIKKDKRVNFPNVNRNNIKNIIEKNKNKIKNSTTTSLKEYITMVTSQYTSAIQGRLLAVNKMDEKLDSLNAKGVNVKKEKQKVKDAKQKLEKAKKEVNGGVSKILELNSENIEVRAEITIPEGTKSLEKAQDLIYDSNDLLREVDSSIKNKLLTRK